MKKWCYGSSTESIGNHNIDDMHPISLFLCNLNCTIMDFVIIFVVLYDDVVIHKLSGHVNHACNDILIFWLKTLLLEVLIVYDEDNIN